MTHKIALAALTLVIAGLLAVIVFQRNVLARVETEATRLRRQLSERTSEHELLKLELASKSRLLARMTAPPPETPAPAESARPAGATASATPAAGESARMRRNLSAMMNNPAANKMMQATQRAAMGVLYESLIRSLDMNPEEEAHLLDLLVARQMKRSELSMNIMSADPAERAALMLEFNQGEAELRSNIEAFLNSPDDTARFSRYEESLGERMAISGFAESLSQSGVELPESTLDNLVEVMRQERAKFKFTGNYNNPGSGIDPSLFTTSAVATQMAELEALDARIASRLGSTLPLDQLALFRQNQERMRSMTHSQLEMAARMFGAGK